jgi:hypothetical protein
LKWPQQTKCSEKQWKSTHTFENLTKRKKESEETPVNSNPNPPSIFDRILLSFHLLFVGFLLPIPICDLDFILDLFLFWTVLDIFSWFLVHFRSGSPSPTVFFLVWPFALSGRLQSLATVHNHLP